MRLHENEKLFRQAIQSTAQQRGILDIYVEKDYWVTYAIKTVFDSDCGGYSVFKGGTALSKCYQIIERFSEDIDLVVLREEGESGNSLTRKIKSITDAVSQVLPQVEKKELTSKKWATTENCPRIPKNS